MPCILGNTYGYTTGGGSHDQSFAYTVAAGSNFLVAFFACYADTASEHSDITGVTYNGVAMTELGIREINPSVGDGHTFILLWILANPAVGSNTFAYTTTDNAVHSSVCISDWGMVKSYRTYAQNGGYASPASITTITSAILDTVLCGIMAYQGAPSDSASGQSTVVAVAGTTVLLSQIPGAASTTTMSWTMGGTSNNWGVMGVALEPENGGQLIVWSSQ